MVFFWRRAVAAA